MSISWRSAAVIKLNGFAVAAALAAATADVAVVVVAVVNCCSLKTVPLRKYCAAAA